MTEQQNAGVIDPNTGLPFQSAFGDIGQSPGMQRNYGGLNNFDYPAPATAGDITDQYRGQGTNMLRQAMTDAGYQTAPAGGASQYHDFR